VLSTIGKDRSRLLTIPLVVLLPFGALLLSGCSSNEGDDHSSEETTAAANVPVSWNYVALGDSLAVGTGAYYKGYVDRYADYLEADTGAQVTVTNLGKNGKTSSELLYALRSDSSSRKAIKVANVVTFNIGINDLGQAGAAYESGTCGGADNQDCLRAAVGTLKENWDAIINELLILRSTSDTIIRTAGLGYVPDLASNDSQVFKPYLDEINGYIATVASNNDIPYAEVHLDQKYMSQDGVHPNDEGYEVIAERLRELEYSPLR
jgi:lysophospholipase L1-like esterase